MSINRGTRKEDGVCVGKLLSHVYVESRETVQMILFAKQKWRHRCQIYGHKGELGVGGVGGLTHIHY